MRRGPGVPFDQVSFPDDPAQPVAPLTRIGPSQRCSTPIRKRYSKNNTPRQRGLFALSVALTRFTPPRLVNIRPWLKTLSPKEIRWTLIIVAILLAANFQVVLDPVAAITISVVRKLAGQSDDCSWPRTLTTYWDVDLFDQLRAPKSRLLERDDEFGIVLLEHPAVNRRFWIREQGAQMDGSALLSYLIGEQQWIIEETPQARIKPGDIVVDCGAHVGAFSDRAFREGASKVIAFEPDPIQIECLRRNFAPEIEAGKFVLIKKAVWSDVGTTTFHIGAGNSGTGSVVEQPADSSLEVELTTIDRVVRELRLPRVDIIKMDIEGAEREALKGARSTLETHRPRLLIDANHVADDVTVLPRMLRDVHPDYGVHNGPCMMGDKSGNPRLVTSYLFFE